MSDDELLEAGHFNRLPLLAVVMRVFTFLFLLLAFFSFGQKQAAVWYFGEYAGLDFNFERPVTLTNGVLYAPEGSASISSETGNLMFYTNGVTVYNRNHEPMPNGENLWGSHTTTQTLIVPRPGDPNFFYIFTASPQFDYIFGEGSDSVGFHYSVVDMNLSNGLGDLIQKNALLLREATEKITAVYHKNREDIWVITHEWGNNHFRSYLITENGIDPSPVISAIGDILVGGAENNSNAIGQLKVSPDGTKLANIVYAKRSIEIFEFDALSGKVTNTLEKIINIGDPILSYNGIEFSPNSQYLYFSLSLGFCGFNGTDNPSSIWQYSLLEKRTRKIGEYVGALNQMQLSLNGKIYISACNDITGESDYMAVINNPGREGKASNFQTRAVSLQGRKNKLGLPNFIQSYFRFEDPVIDMPNVFTPNGDDYNPVFKPLAYDHILEAQLKIINRWGEEIFSTPHVQEGWDGENAPGGVYYWLLRYEGKSGKRGIMKGYVHLIR